VNEFEEMLEIEKERAKERKEETGKDNLQNVSGGNVSTTEDTGKAREKAAEKIDAGVSGRTLEKERAKERKEANLKEGDEQPRRGNVSTSGEQGKARDKAAEKIDAGVSGRTLEKGLEVKEKAEQGDEVAQKEWEKLENGDTSFHVANREVKKANNKKKRKEKRQKQKERVQQTYFDDDAVDPTLKVGDAEDLPLEASSVDLIITSPPYNLGHDDWQFGGEGRTGRENGIGYEDDRDETEYQQWQLNVLQELYRVADGGASLFYNHKPRQRDGKVIHPMDWLRDDSNPWTLRQEIVWNRKATHNHSPTIFWPVDERVYWLTKSDPDIPDDGTGMKSVWTFHGPKPDTDHPAPFPDELPRRCIEAVGENGDVVLDPFGGSMTTCEVAAKLGYESIGVDIDEDYVAKKRVEWGLNDG